MSDDLSKKVADLLDKAAKGDSLVQDEIVDPFPQAVAAPGYPDGTLPSIWDERAKMYCRVHGSYMELYTAPFLAIIAGVLQSTVKVQIEPADNKSATVFVDQVIAVAEPASGKTPSQDQLLTTLKSLQDALQREQTIILSNLKEGAKQPPEKSLFATNATVEYLAWVCGVNENLPITFAPGESAQGLSSIAAHRSDLESAVADVYRNGWDGLPLSYGRKTGKLLYVKSMRLNTLLTGTIDDLTSWPGLPLAMRNGMLARMTLYTPGRRIQKDLTAQIIPSVDQSITKTLVAMSKANHILVKLPPNVGKDLAGYDEAMQNASVAHSSTNPAYATYLRKNHVRLVRWAGAFALWDHYSGFDEGNMKEAAVSESKFDKNYELQMQMRHLSKASDMVEWLSKQQLHIYQNLLFTDAVGVEVKNITHTILCDELSEISRDQMTNKGTSQMRRWMQNPATRYSVDQVILRLLEYGIIQTDPSARNPTPYRPEMAGKFRVNPTVHTKLARRKGEAIIDVERRRAAARAAFFKG